MIDGQPRHARRTLLPLPSPAATRPLSAALVSRLPAGVLDNTKLGPVPRARRDLGPCLLWTGALHKTKGYARHYAEGQDWLAHRYAWLKCATGRPLTR